MKSTSIRKLLFLFGLTALLVSLNPIRAQETGPTPYPDAKDEKAWPGVGPIRLFGWMPDNRKGFWANREKDQGKIVFVGDSIVGGWKLETDFAGKPVVNRGIGGDTSRGLLFRFQEDVLDLHPKAIVIEIGANDVSADGSVEQTLANYNAILDLAQKANPDTPIFIMALLPQGIPTGDKAPKPDLLAYFQKVHPRIPQIDAELAKIPAARKNVTFIDTYPVLLNPDGTQDTTQFAPDCVHPTGAGHSKLAVPVTKALTDKGLL